MKDDLISRQKVIDAINNKMPSYPGADAQWKNGYLIGCSEAYKIIHYIQSAQPEIIHCAECKWFQCNMRSDGYLPKGVDEYECRHWCGGCDPMDFCSHAERRTE